MAISQDRLLIYGLVAANVFLVLILAVSLFMIFDLGNKLNKSQKDIDALKITVSSIGTIINTHLSDYDQLKKEHDEYGVQLGSQQSQLTGLNKSVNTLEGNFTQFKSKYIDLKDKYVNLENYSTALSNQLDAFETTLMGKWQWIRDNAVMQPVQVSKIEDPLDEYCGPDIKIPCIPIVLNMKEDFHYIQDYGDQIKPVKDFITEKGGDCEDWSLFMKAYINSKSDNKLIRAYEDGGSEDYKIYEDGSNIYFYSNSRDVKIGRKGDLDTTVICYDMGAQGHCILAFTNKTAPGDTVLEKLNGSIAVEPQSGLVMGHVYNPGDGTDKLYLNTQGYDLPIYILVTDDDLYLFEENVWNSYGLQYSKFESLKNPN